MEKIILRLAPKGIRKHCYCPRQRKSSKLIEAISSSAGTFCSRAWDHGVQGGVLSRGNPQTARRPASSQEGELLMRRWGARTNGHRPQLPPRAARHQSGRTGPGTAAGMGGHLVKGGHSTGRVERLEVHITQEPGTVL